MILPDFHISHPKNQEDIDQELNLIREVFDITVENMVRKFLEKHPRMSLKDHLLVKHRNRAVAGLQIIPQTWSLGGVELKIAEVGCVSTHPEFRGRGLQRLLMDHAHKQIQEEGYDLSVIEGIPYFYRQFGYEYAIPLDIKTSMEMEDIPVYEEKHEIRSLEPEDIPMVMELLDHHNQRYLIHGVRDRGIWEMQEKEFPSENVKSETFVCLKEGKITSYFRKKGEKDREIIIEASEMSVTQIRSMLNFIRTRSPKGILESRLSSDHPVTILLKSLGAETSRHYAWQIRITHLPALLRKLIPLFEERLAKSLYRDLDLEINLNFYKFTIKTTILDGRIQEMVNEPNRGVREVRINPYVFPKLLTGYKSIDELTSIYPDIRIEPAYRELINTLFPKGPSFIYTCY
jgi:predicted acetyltransferase